MDLRLPTKRDPDTWQLFIWNLPDELLSRAQKLQLMLMMEAHFNDFDPYRVVGDLLRHRNLWEGAVMDRGYVNPRDEQGFLLRLRADLIKLRDIDEYWNVDTLFLTTEFASADSLRALAEKWQADEVGFIEGDAAGGLLGAIDVGQCLKILTVWWD